MGNAIEAALEGAWAEYQEAAHRSGGHVGTLEAMQLLREATSETSQTNLQKEHTSEQEEQALFFDWLLHIKGEKALAYELLRRTGTLTVGPRQYWVTRQGDRRAIAWESSYTYPGTDSEIWDVITVD
jgi:hypothetical protein